MSDLISRQAVLDYPIRLDHYDEEHGDRHFVLGIESVMEYVEYLPSAEPQWISVDDRLPEKRQVVLAIGKDSKTWDVGMFKGLSPSHNNHVWWWKKNTVKRVDYWMPKDAVPLPWKE